MPTCAAPARLLGAAVLGVTVLSAGLTGCAGDVAAERAGAWVAGQPHIEKVLGEEALRRGDLGALVSPRAALVVAQVEAGASPSDLAGLPDAMREYLDHAPGLDGMTLILRGRNWETGLTALPGRDLPRLEALQRLVSLPTVTFARLPLEPSAASVRLGTSTPLAEASPIFAAAAGWDTPRSPLTITRTGSPSVATASAVQISTSVRDLLVRLDHRTAVTSVQVGPLEEELTATPTDQLSAEAPRPALPLAAPTDDVVTVVAAGPANAVRLLPTIRSQARQVGGSTEVRVAAWGRGAQSTPPRLAFVASGRATVGGDDLERLADLAQRPGTARLVLSQDALTIEGAAPFDVSRAAAAAPAVEDLRIYQAVGPPLGLRGSSAEVGVQAALAEAAVGSGVVSGVWAEGDRMTLHLGSGSPDAAPLFRALHTTDWDGSRTFVITEQLGSDSAVSLTFRATSDGPAEDPRWDSGNFPHSDPDLVDRSARALLAAWDASAPRNAG